MKTDSKVSKVEMVEDVEGTVQSVVFRNDETGYSVLRVIAEGGREAIVVGMCAAVWEGEELHATGTWITDPVHGRQFKAQEITCVTPKSVEGIRRYLSSGLIKGIGPIYAAKIVARFGEDTIDILDNHSGRLKEVRGIGESRIETIRESWKQERATREVMIFMQQYGISVTKAAKIYRRYGPDSVAIVKRDPYRLCRDIWGIGFATADRIALSVGMPKDAPERARASILHTLEVESDEGHCWTNEPDLLLHAHELVEISVEKLAEALQAEIAENRVAVEGGGEETKLIFLKNLYLAERRTVAKVGRLLTMKASCAPIDPEKAIAWWEKKAGFSLAPAQLRAVRTCLLSKVSIITGGPGVGKTTIIRALVDIYNARRMKVLLAAPTGRAAKRMGESTGEEAQTFHRLLKYNPRTESFTYNEAEHLEGDVFIFDEMSMTDIRLMADLVAALPPEATLILVGDIDQLPSVGPGNVLRDLISSEVIPCSRLTEIFRQDNSGLIVRNAHRINEGKGLETKSGESDFYFVAKENPAEILNLALDFMINRIPRKFGMDPLRDVQVLSPMRKNLLGAENLNIQLQAKLNGTGLEVRRGGMIFRQGDRVMQLRNNYDKDVYNGDVGFVRAVNIGERGLVVDFDGRPVEYKSGDLDELTLAYATTIHKSQGSEYPAVVIVVHPQHYMLLQRNLLYTAITRGRKLVMVIGTKWAVNRAIETNTVRERRTTLAERLCETLTQQSKHC